MKYVLSFVFAFTSIPAFASGYVCEGHGYKVQQYNELHVATARPAVLVVSSDRDGFVLKLRERKDLNHSNNPDAWVYYGQGHANGTGHFAYAELEVNRTVKYTFGGHENPEAVHEGELRLNIDGRKIVVGLDCQRYLKGN